jgi:small subunit ribosomal protein S4
MKLMLKGERCYTEKCAFNRRSYAPGVHGQRPRKLSDYGLQLREKQKVRRVYGILENQFRRYFQMADGMKGVTGENLLSLLERRLDNAVFRAGFAINRCQARQLVRHGHIRVNARKVNIPSFLVKAGDVITVKEKSRNVAPILQALEVTLKKQNIGWLELEPEKLAATVKDLPGRSDVDVEVNEQLIVELYSK